MRKATWVVFMSIFVGVLIGCSDLEREKPHSMTPEELQAFHESIEQEKRLENEKRQAFESKLKDLEKFASPVRLSDPIYFRAKGVVIGPSERYSPGVLISTEETAGSIDEMRTVIQIICRKGAKVGAYPAPLSSRMIPAYATICRVSIIDTSIPAIVGRKDFANKEVPEEIKVPLRGRKEVIAANPFDEIKSFIQNLPRR